MCIRDSYTRELMKQIPQGWLFVIGCITAASASIAASSAETAIKARHDHYHELGDAFKVIRDELRSSSPNWDRIKPAAQAVKEASADQGKWFPTGSGPESGLKTRSKAEIWSDPKGFEAAQLSSRARHRSSRCWPKRQMRKA